MGGTSTLAVALLAAATAPASALLLAGGAVSSPALLAAGGTPRRRACPRARALLCTEPAPEDDGDGEGWVSSFAPPPGFECEDDEECVLPDFDDDDDDDSDAPPASRAASPAMLVAEPSMTDLLAPGPRWSADETETHSSVELTKVRANRRDPPNPAEALRAAGSGDRLLDEMELACCWLSYEAACPELPLPRFRVTARPSKILEPELRQMACVLRAALDREEDFTILWDLRKLVPPSLSALDYGSKWQSENAADIERLGKSIVVLVSSPITRVCANLCTRVCNPPQPTRICTKEEEAVAWAAEQYSRVPGSQAS